MTKPLEEPQDEELVDRFTDVLLVLDQVGNGDYDSRLKKDLPEEEPMMLLYEGLNEMIDSLAQKSRRNTVYQQELEEKLLMIEAQRAAIRELSTPIIEVWRDVLCLPIVGVMDTTRSAETMTLLLDAVVEKNARYVIIDITGIQIMDTGTADHFIRMVRVVRLMGAESVLTGVNPAIAMTIQTMGVNLEELTAFRSLRDALQHYLESVGSMDGGLLVADATEGGPSSERASEESPRANGRAG